MLRAAGAEVETASRRHNEPGGANVVDTWRVHPGPIRPGTLAVEPDVVNAAPFLASRITRDLSPSRLEMLAAKLPLPLRPVSKNKQFEALLAMQMLVACSKPPEEMLRQLLQPALDSTNAMQRYCAQGALPLRPPGGPWF